MCRTKPYTTSADKFKKRDQCGPSSPDHHQVMTSHHIASHHTISHVMTRNTYTWCHMDIRNTLLSSNCSAVVIYGKALLSKWFSTKKSFKGPAGKPPFRLLCARVFRRERTAKHEEPERGLSTIADRARAQMATTIFMLMHHNTWYRRKISKGELP